MKNIVCIAAHPDDLEFSCIGTLRKMVEKGYQLIYVIVTNGENGFKQADVNREDRIETRKKEQELAAKTLDVKEIIFLEYKDGFLEYCDELREQICQIIKKFKPEIVFSFDPSNKSYSSLNLFHRDHRVTAEVVFDAIFAAKNKYIYAGEAHKVSEIYFFASENPNHFEDIEDQINFKLNTLKIFKSQYNDFSRLENFVTNELSKKNPELNYSEVFRKITIRQIL